MSLTFLELFAGAGGMSMGLEAAGLECLGHAEVNPDAMAVLAYRWPDCPLYGDVSALDGKQFKGVDLISGGSPCQDLSVAGKRAGVTEGSLTRSSLFFEQIRIWHESEADLHTLIPKDGKLLSDSARYRLCGNGVVSSVAEWIGMRLIEAVRGAA